MLEWAVILATLRKHFGETYHQRKISSWNPAGGAADKRGTALERVSAGRGLVVRVSAPAPHLDQGGRDVASCSFSEQIKEDMDLRVSETGWSRLWLWCWAGLLRGPQRAGVGAFLPLVGVPSKCPSSESNYWTWDSEGTAAISKVNGRKGSTWVLRKWGEDSLEPLPLLVWPPHFSPCH